MQQVASDRTVSLYAVVAVGGKFFAGFDTQKKTTVFTDSIMQAKLFSNKHDIKLRPGEQLVEVKLNMTHENSTVSAPFRPVFKAKKAC